MEKQTKDLTAPETLDETMVYTENPAYEPGEMIGCDTCRRMNPPNRPNCLYCGAALPASGGAAAGRFAGTDWRRLENWERGFNVLAASGDSEIEEAKLAEISAPLNLEKEILREILASGNFLPVARVETETRAEDIQNLLLEAGAKATIVGDESLKTDKPPRRLRAMDFRDDKLILILFNGDEVVEIGWANLCLIVTGAIFERRVEATESRRKKYADKLLDANETASDEALFDFYDDANRLGYRVSQKGFDFSCLGAEKSLLAVENIKKLAARLSERAANVELVEDYIKMRPLLANVWQVEERTESRGLKRETFGGFNLENVTTVGNSEQFTKYSRLRRHLR